MNLCIVLIPGCIVSLFWGMVTLALAQEHHKGHSVAELNMALLGHALHRSSPIAIRTAAWYPKTEATFSDVLAAVRRECWSFLDSQTSLGDPFYAEIPRSQLDRLLNAVCYAH
jgi:hypothetical protein